MNRPAPKTKFQHELAKDVNKFLRRKKNRDWVEAEGLLDDGPRPFGKFLPMNIEDASDEETKNAIQHGFIYRDGQFKRGFFERDEAALEAAAKEREELERPKKEKERKRKQ